MAQIPLLGVVAEAAVAEARGGALPLQVAVVLVGVAGKQPPLSVWRSGTPTVFRTKVLAHAIHPIQVLLSHLGDAVETLAAHGLLLHHLPLEVPADPFLG